MPRIPRYSRHKATGLAYVYIAGKRLYLGKHGTPASIEAYNRIIARIAAGEQPTEPPKAGDGLTVSELLLRFRDHAERHYRKNGKPTSELGNFKRVSRALRERWGHVPAAEFRCSHLRTVRDDMVAAGRCRNSINLDMSRCRSIWRWGAENELVDPSVYAALKALSPLRKGRSEAAESEPVRPVAREDVDRTLKHLPEVVADMVKLQLLTGARPGEIVALKPGCIDRSSDVWIANVAEHKTSHHELGRVLVIGPQGQGILSKYLFRDDDAFCFSPAESEMKRHRRQREARKSSVQPSQALRSRHADTTSGANDGYTVAAYRRAIYRAATKAGVASWSPHRLRHSRATEIRKELGIEIAQIVLGHSSLKTSEVYAEKNLAAAIDAMRRIG